MALTSADIQALTDFTWSDIKIACKNAIANGLLGGARLRMPDGRELMRVTPAEAKQIYQWACDMEQLEAMGETGGTAVAQFGDPI